LFSCLFVQYIDPASAHPTADLDFAPDSRDEPGADGPSFSPRPYFGQGPGSRLAPLQAPPPPPVASSSFTSDTGSSLADDDLTSLSNMYEIPPMASPPKFDFGDWTSLS
jgi:hypothetical protein